MDILRAKVERDEGQKRTAANARGASRRCSARDMISSRSSITRSTNGAGFLAACACAALGVGVGAFACVGTLTLASAGAGGRKTNALGLVIGTVSVCILLECTFACPSRLARVQIDIKCALVRCVEPLLDLYLCS